MFDPNLLLFNIQGLREDKVDNIIIDFLSDDNNLKFLCFTEVWYPKDFIQLCKFNNFILSSSFCPDEFIHGGVGIWIKMGLELREFCIEKHIEICGIKWIAQHATYIILVCYKSPSGNLKLFHEGIYNVLTSLYDPTYKFVL